MATYRQKSDGSYEIASNTGWLTLWNAAPEGWTPSSTDTQYGVAPSNPSHGDTYYDYSGNKRFYDSGSGKWVSTATWQNMPGNGPGVSVGSMDGVSYVSTPDGVYAKDASGNRVGDPIPYDQWSAEYDAYKDALKLADWQQKFGDVGGSIDYVNGRYVITGADGRKYSTNNFAGVQSIWNSDFYDGARFSGNLWDPYGDLTVGPLERNDQFPDGTGGDIVWVGDENDPPPPTMTGMTSYADWLAARENPTGTGGGAFRNIFDMIGGLQTGNQVSDPNPTNPWTGGTSGDFPYNPPPGIPLNPIVSENPNIFSPYGQAAARMSNITTFGGLPRSTGPWNEMGGYYGGNPYTEMPQGYRPPRGPNAGSPGAPIDSPWQPPVGGGSPDPNRPGPWLPPATPITLPDPLTPEQIAEAEAQQAQAAALRAAGL